MTMILRLLFNALGLLLISELIDGITVGGLYPAIIAAVVLGILNIIIRPILLILTLPITIVTLGLFAFVVNASLFLFAASFIEGFEVQNFWYALLGSLLMSVVSTIGNRWINQESTKKTIEYREIRED
ncbi:phage holin family protein [Candidatus Nomurabacteria bacterium]|nr:phage holin family protein [Candidatus Kaiserbacteria bacterium]MCB9810005.1 phage holin family protein [Candidatus Nomurabacteria bacterium]